MTRLPSPQRRLPTPQHTRRLRPKTYSIAVYLVGAVILLQVAAVASIFWLRAMVVSVGVNVPKAKPGTTANLPTVVTPPIIPATQANTATPPTPNLVTLPSLNMPMSHPAMLSIPSVSDKIEQINSLIDQAKVFQHQNDLKSAAYTLVKAEDIDPRNPTTLRSLAEIYYLMNDSVQSKQYWQRLVDLGPGVGTVYALAKDHVLLLGSQPESDPLRQPSTLPRLIFIDDVQKTQVDTLNGQPQFHVRTVLMRKDPRMPQFDQKKLRPFVIFYQQMPDGSLTPDLTQHKGAFDDTFLFWGHKNYEPFGVDYVMPIPGTPGPNNSTMGEYYGFVIGIYYNNELQDARSEPTDLVTRMPLPPEIE